MELETENLPDGLFGPSRNVKLLYSSSVAGKLVGLEIGSSGSEYKVDYTYAAADRRLDNGHRRERAERRTPQTPAVGRNRLRRTFKEGQVGNEALSAVRYFARSVSRLEASRFRTHSITLRYSGPTGRM